MAAVQDENAPGEKPLGSSGGGMMSLEMKCTLREEMETEQQQTQLRAPF